MTVSEEVIKDYTGRILGYLCYQPNGDIIVKDFYRKNLGRYDKAMDVTKDFYGKILFKGNMAAALIGMFGNQ